MTDDSTPRPDPVATLWIHALRTQLDAVVTGVEAQLTQHVAAQQSPWVRRVEALTAERDALALALAQTTEAARLARAEADDRGQRLQEAQQALTELQSEAASLQARVTALLGQQAALDEARVRDGERLRALQAQLGDLGERVVALDEQFVQERAFVEAALSVRSESLFEALQQHLGAPLEPSPGSLGALKARKPDVVLLAALRERGRTALRDPLSPGESEALEALARAASCALVLVAPGARFNAAQMERVGTRSEPAEEGHVLECVTPGLRLAGSAGSLLHPRVIVATG